MGAARAAERRGLCGAYLLDVSPEAWRRELLLPRERQSATSSKAAARLIARQLAAGAVGAEAASGSFDTDAAEAVLSGYHAVRSLGWRRDVDRPPVARYTNGAVRPLPMPAPPARTGSAMKT